eukprot:5936669-Prymnesium_polylepis.2
MRGGCRSRHDSTRSSIRSPAQQELMWGCKSADICSCPMLAPGTARRRASARTYRGAVGEVAVARLVTASRPAAAEAQTVVPTCPSPRRNSRSTPSW